MNELIDRLVTNVGIDQPTAEKAVGIILGFLKKEGPPERVQSLIDGLPGAGALIESQQAEGGGMFDMGGVMGVGTKLMGAGLSMGQVQSVTKEIIAYTREKAGDEAVGEIVAAIPGLSQFVDRSQFGTLLMLSYPLTDIEGIDREIAATLKSAGVRSSNALLDAAATARGRKLLATKTGLSEKLLLQWANFAHFISIRGVNRGYAALLHKSGVDTVTALKFRNPAKLAAAMAQMNRTRKLVRVLPSEKRIVRWIDDAKKLPSKISY